MAEIAPGVWLLSLRSPTLPPAVTTNTCIFAGDRVLIIEPATPYPDEQAKLDLTIRGLERQGKTVAGIALTHHHVDHVGYATELRAKLGVPVIAHRETSTRVSCPVDQLIDHGWSIDLGQGHLVQARFTPGHAPGHLIFVSLLSRYAYAGDLVAGEGTIQIDPEDSGDMKEYLESLESTLSYCRKDDGPQRLIASHGPVIDDACGVLQHFIQHRLAREQRILEVLDKQTLSIDNLLAGAYADKPPQILSVARPALLAHLNKLVFEGRVRRNGDNLTRIDF